jgi:hypothetical protein
MSKFESERRFKVKNEKQKMLEGIESLLVSKVENER